MHLYTLKKPLTATVVGNYRLTAPDTEADVHHNELDFGTHVIPLLEGQSIAIVPPGVDSEGRPHYPRMYSLASPRSGEREGYNNASLTVKRVTSDHEGQATVGILGIVAFEMVRVAMMMVVGGVLMFLTQAS